MDTRDTDEMYLDRDVRARLEESLVADGTCLLFESTSATIFVRARGYHGMVRACPSRVAWALANPQDHLQRDELAIHTCQNTGANGTKLCCNEAHLIKGRNSEKTIARRARAKRMLDK